MVAVGLGLTVSQSESFVMAHSGSNNNKTPDKQCAFHPDTLKKCHPDKDGNCPSGFSRNESGNCFPSGKCPKGFERHDDDESGRCFHKHKHST
jgi:hypothetical protein